MGDSIDINLYKSLCDADDRNTELKKYDGDYIEVTKSDMTAKLVRLSDISFLEVLRQKMAGA